MVRKGFKMKLYPGMEAEYEKRHNELWPEMQDIRKSRVFQSAAGETIYRFPAVVLIMRRDIYCGVNYAY